MPGCTCGLCAAPVLLLALLSFGCQSPLDLRQFTRIDPRRTDPQTAAALRSALKQNGWVHRPANDDSNGRSPGVAGNGAWRWYHLIADQQIKEASPQWRELGELLADSDPMVATGAAIYLARAGQAVPAAQLSAAADRLVEAVATESQPVALRRAAIETLGSIGPNHPRLHQHWPHLLDICAAGERSDGAEPVDPLIRAEILLLAAAMIPEQSEAAVRAALIDGDARVRLAAIRGLGIVAGSSARDELLRFAADRSPQVRAAAVEALAAAGCWAEVRQAADDSHWVVRRSVAVSLVDADNPHVCGAAIVLAEDRSLEVARPLLENVSRWPVEAGVPVLTAARESPILTIRRRATELLKTRAPHRVTEHGMD